MEFEGKATVPGSHSRNVGRSMGTKLRHSETTGSPIPVETAGRKALQDEESLLHVGDQDRPRWQERIDTPGALERLPNVIDGRDRDVQPIADLQNGIGVVVGQRLGDFDRAGIVIDLYLYGGLADRGDIREPRLARSWGELSPRISMNRFA